MITNRQMSKAVACFDFIVDSQAATHRVAHWLQPLLGGRGYISLVGDLGVGKTEFARAFVRAYCGDIIVPSPSFTLVQPYEGDNVRLLHADLYRLGEASEIYELGLIDAMDDHICLIEWADKADGFLPQADVTLRFDMVAGHDHQRHIEISAQDETLVTAVQAAYQRDQQVEQFLATTDWSPAQAQRQPLAGDASTRRYDRLTKTNGHSAVLMDWQSGPDGAADYDGQAYSQVVHLAEATPAYCRMNQWLESHDMRVPQILASDEAAGFVLLEDLGDMTLAALDKAGDERQKPIVYAEAIDNLVHLHAQPAADFLAAYDGRVQAIETSLFLDWYLQWRGIKVSQNARQIWMSLWQDLGDSLMAAPKVSVLRDFHSVNMLWQPQAQGRYRLGLIDVQDALAGHAAYDLVSLLQDARLNVSPKQVDHSYQSYVDARFDLAADQQAFARAYAIAGAQRNFKIAGIFVRLAQRDAKPNYLNHLPRIIGYIQGNLAHSALADIAAWLEAEAPMSLALDAGDA